MSRRLAMATGIAVIVAATLAAAAPAGKNGPIAVVTTMADSQNLFPLRVGSDTAGPYLDTAKALNSEIGRYATGTDWMMTTYYGVRIRRRTGRFSLIWASRHHSITRHLPSRRDICRHISLPSVGWSTLTC